MIFTAHSSTPPGSNHSQPTFHRVIYCIRGPTAFKLAPFLDAHQNAGHHVDVLFPNQMDVWSSEAGSEAGGDLDT